MNFLSPSLNIARKGVRERGFTLIETALVIVIAGILLTVAMKTATSISSSAKYEESKQKLVALEQAICGNPALQNNGSRADFGYVGDIGALPPNLTALQTNPGGYSTWKGPYIRGRFQQIASDFGQDSWGSDIAYSNTGTLTSSGSGSNIVRTFANSSSDLLLNSVSGLVADHDGVPPGQNYGDSISVSITVPNGSGGTVIKSTTPNAAGYFQFDSIPIGVHDLRIAYAVTGDTIYSLVTTSPASRSFNQFRFEHSLWTSGSGLAMVNGSDSLSGAPACTDVTFWLTNTSGIAVTITSMKVSWSSPTAYYGQIYFNGNLVFDKAGSPRGLSGSTYTFSSSQTVASGAKIRVRVLDFRSSNSNGGGAGVSMSNVSLTITLSDGTTFTEGLPSCP